MMVWLLKLPLVTMWSTLVMVITMMMTPVHGWVAPLPLAITMTMTVRRSAIPRAPPTLSGCQQQQQQQHERIFAAAAAKLPKTTACCHHHRSSRVDFFHLNSDWSNFGSVNDDVLDNDKIPTTAATTTAVDDDNDNKDVLLYGRAID